MVIDGHCWRRAAHALSVRLQSAVQQPQHSQWSGSSFGSRPRPIHPWTTRDCSTPVPAASTAVKAAADGQYGLPAEQAQPETGLASRIAARSFLISTSFDLNRLRSKYQHVLLEARDEYLVINFDSVPSPRQNQMLTQQPRGACALRLHWWACCLSKLLSACLRISHAWHANVSAQVCSTSCTLRLPRRLHCQHARFRPLRHPLVVNTRGTTPR